MHYLDIARIIKAMDPPEADAMGISCRYFTRTLVDDFAKELIKEKRDFFKKAALWDDAE